MNPTATRNDEIRKLICAGKPVEGANLNVSPRVAELGTLRPLLDKIGSLEEFDEELDLDNDHSVGIVELDGVVFLFGFDYVDSKREELVELKDVTDETYRRLTIRLTG